jgi:rubrerythrin
MLIKKTEQIINHIKDLKQITSRSVEKSKYNISEITRPEYIEEPTEIDTNQVSTTKEKQVQSIQAQENHQLSKPLEKEIKVIEKSDIKNIPKGFKEIETSEDFTVITPYDKEYVTKILNEDVDMSIFRHPENESETKSEQILGKTDEGKKLICFACGTELPSNSKKCPNCGTLIK